MRLAAHQGLEDDQICRAVDEMNEGLIDANLGAGLRLPNIQDKELKALKHLAKFYIAMKPNEIRAALDCGELREVNCDE